MQFVQNFFQIFRGKRTSEKDDELVPAQANKQVETPKVRKSRLQSWLGESAEEAVES